MREEGELCKKKRAHSHLGGEGECIEGLSHSKDGMGPGEVRAGLWGALYNLGNNSTVLSRGTPCTRDQQIPPTTCFCK